MAVEYHLLTCLGRDGVSVTVATTGVVTLANHGMRAGHAVRFTNTGGALPGGLVADTTYYVSATDLDAGSFKVSATNGGSVVDITSTGSGTNKVIGAYWATLPATDPGGGGNYRARYGSAGSERVFAGMYYWFASLVAAASQLKEIILEIEGAWDDTNTNYTAGAALTGYYSIAITSKINGQYGSAFHNGNLSGGYRRINSYSSITINISNQLNCIVDGLEIINTKTAASSNYAISGATGYVAKNCIIQSTGQGIKASVNSNIYNNFVHDCINAGILGHAYFSGPVIYNNTVVGCGVGIDATNGAIHHIIGNVCVGNTTNWGVAPSGGLWANNAGETGDTIWTTAGQSNITGLTAADFENYIVPATSASDFSPSGDSTAHTSSSKLVDVGSQLIALMEAQDIRLAARPSYKNGASTAWDIGAYEFDWGYGLEPLQVTLSISGMAEGSALAVYKTSDGSTIISPTTIGASGSYSTTYSYTGDTQVEVIVRKGTSENKYLPYSAPGLITANGFSLIVNQVIDGVLNG